MTINKITAVLGPTKIGDEIIGKVKIEKITNALVFASCKIESKNKIIAVGSGVWKRTNNSF